MESSDATALNEGPKALNRLGMDCTDNALHDVLAFAVIDGGVREAVAQSVIASEIVGAKQADFSGYSLINELLQNGSAHTIDNAGDDVALALHRTDDGRFVLCGTASAGVVFLIPMTVLVLTADVGFIDLDNAAELIQVLNQSSADFVTHGPCGFVGTEAHDALYLESGNAFLAGQHHVDDAEPLPQVFICVLKNSPGNMGKSVAGFWSALVALPRPRAIGQLVGVLRAATRATDTVRPSTGNQIGATSFFIREHGFELGDGELVDGFRSLSHGNLPCAEGYCQ